MFRKPLFSYGAVALAAAVLSLAAPRAAHAIAATLVQVTNTAANPAITQGTEKQAAQLVDLFAESGQSEFYNVLPTGNFVYGYTIPSNQYLVITGVDVTPTCAGSAAFTLITSGTLEIKSWYVAGGNTTHFDYPSGILLAPGLTPTANLNSTGNCTTFVQMHGYLTSN
jgi:hypothetical protein